MSRTACPLPEPSVEDKPPLRARPVSLVIAGFALALGGAAQFLLSQGKLDPALIAYAAAAVLSVTSLRSFMPEDPAGPR